MPVFVPMDRQEPCSGCEKVYTVGVTQKQFYCQACGTTTRLRQPAVSPETTMEIIKSPVVAALLVALILAGLVVFFVLNSNTQSELDRCNDLQAQGGLYVPTPRCAELMR